MNPLSPYHSTSSEVLLKRFRLWRRQYLHVVIYTSLFWIFVDVFFIMLFSDCTKEIIIPCSSSLSTNKNSKIIDHNVQLHPKIIIDKINERKKVVFDNTTMIDATKKNIAPKWWKIDPGATNPMNWHGEGGRAVVVPDELKEEAKKRFAENQFNILASDLMALNRSIKDQRSARCLSHKFPPDLPSTSIIIVFHNEGNSTLLRTLTSIILRSPIQYIHEIIMVDDASINREYLKDTLEAFTKELPVSVRILRNTERLGLMKSRLRGAQIATGDTLTFLDAHIECSPGWLQYLLYEVKKDRLGFSCIIYLILSNFSHLSVENIIPRTWIRSVLTNNTDKIVLKSDKHDINPINRIENKSFICDRMRKNDGTREENVSSEVDDHLINILRPYCDIVPILRNNWISARHYIESDIIFIIYTGASFYHSRATAVRDTWLSRVTYKYFFSQTPYSSLPVTVIEGAGETYLSNIKKLYRGMQIAYKKHNQTAKFYFLASCDTFVNVPHLLKRLESFDYKQPIIIGGFPSNHTCYVKRNATNDIISYPSGGAGFLLSAHMMKLMVPKLNSYFENDWPLTENTAHTDGKKKIHLFFF
ncbi:unnamed protein product [Rotaria sp. Silwood2]|nr:unnamed protein product [Rotaria sp. Silwood2]